MPDVFTRAKRSLVMSRIRSRGNASTELSLASALRRAGIGGWRRHVALAGKPDFVFSPARVCVFVHGCFWHGCPTCYRAPTSNSEYWRDKVRSNRRRDMRVARKLRADGYTVVSVWECQLGRARIASVLRRLRRYLDESVAELRNPRSYRAADHP